MTTPRLGSDTPSKLYLGSDELSKLYLGNDLIYTAVEVESVTVNLTGYADISSQNLITWPDNISIGSTFDALGETQILTTAALDYTGPTPGQVLISIIGTNNRFTPAFESTGRIIFEASDGETLEVMIADADMSEPYNWTPANSAEVIVFANHVRGLTDKTATLTLALP